MTLTPPQPIPDLPRDRQVPNDAGKIVSAVTHGGMLYVATQYAVFVFDPHLNEFIALRFREMNL